MTLKYGHAKISHDMHHPHYRGHSTAEDGTVTWDFKPFTGTEPNPGDYAHRPDQQERWIRLFGANDPEEIDGRSWLNNQHIRARELWQAARMGRTVAALAEHVIPVALDYNTATEAVHTAWDAILSGRDDRFRGNVLRLRAAHADLVTAAEEFDTAVYPMVEEITHPITRKLIRPEIGTTALTRALPTPSRGMWPLGLVDDYHPDEPDQRPAAAEAHRLITDQLDRLADLRNIVGTE